MKTQRTDEQPVEKHQGVQAVQELYDAFRRRDLPGILDCLAEDVDWLFVGRPQDVPIAGPRLGREVMVDFFVTAAAVAEMIEFVPLEIMVCGEQVIVVGQEKGRARATGRVWETPWVHIFTVREGRIVRLREFYDTATIAEALRPA